MSQTYKAAAFIQLNWISSEMKPIYSFHATLACFELAPCGSSPSFRKMSHWRQHKEEHVPPNNEYLHLLSFLWKEWGYQGKIALFIFKCIFC